MCGDVMVVTNTISFDHDVQYAARQLLTWIDELEDRKLVGTYSSDYADLDKWLNNGTDILISYCSGPVADDENTEVLQAWLEGGGRMIGIHGTSGGCNPRAFAFSIGQSTKPWKRPWFELSREKRHEWARRAKGEAGGL